MRSFAIAMLITLVLGLSISIPYQVLSGSNSAEVKGVLVRQRVDVPLIPTASEEVVNKNVITIKELSTNNVSIIQFNTEVNESTVDTAISKIKKVNKENKKSVIYLLLDSPGGSVFDGARLITAMENSKVPVYTICTVRCASMAAQILEHGKERYMIDRSTVMFHPASIGLMVEGEVDKIYSRLGHGKRFIDKLDMYVAKRSGQTYESFKAKSMQEYWRDAEDALQEHLIDAIVSIDYEKETPPTLLFGNKFKLDLQN